MKFSTLKLIHSLLDLHVHDLEQSCREENKDGNIPLDLLGDLQDARLAKRDFEAHNFQ